VLLLVYSGADDKLRVVDRRSCLLFPSSETTSTCDPTHPPAYERRSAFEEYRYDALGRRCWCAPAASLPVSCTA
jgi:hypothetical protein